MGERLLKYKDGKESDESQLHLTSEPAGRLPEKEAPGSKGGSRSIFRFWRRRKAPSFLTVAIARDNLSVVLQCIYTARLLKKKGLPYQINIITHPDNARLMGSAGVFDEIIPAADATQVRREIQRVKPDVIYNPNLAWQEQKCTLFSGVKVKIGANLNRPLARLFSVYDIKNEKDRDRLQRKGIDLEPEFVSFELPAELPEAKHKLPAERFIWLSIFDSGDGSGKWPAGFAACLARLLDQSGIPVVIPVPPGANDQIQSDIRFLSKDAPSIVFLADCTPEVRAAGMVQAALIVAPAGPETILAALLKKPAILLHDLNSYNSYADPRGLKLVDKVSVKKSENRMRDTICFKVTGSQERHLKPPVSNCIQICTDCPYNSCVEYISPEIVFENIKKILSPF